MKNIPGWMIVVVCVMIVSSHELAAADLNGDGIEKVLLPVAFAPDDVVRGARNNSWAGAVWIHNRSSYAINVQPPPACTITFCEGGVIIPGASQQLRLRTNRVSGGALLFLPGDQAERVHLQNRMLNLTQQPARITSVELPVVREDDFLTAPAELLNIRILDDERVAVRVYDPDRVPGSAVTVEVLDVTGRNVLGAIELRPGDSPAVIEDPRDPVPGRPEWFPGYAAILDLKETFPSVSGIVHVRVSPLADGQQFWAFVSVTDRFGDVVVITPN